MFGIIDFIPVRVLLPCNIYHCCHRLRFVNQCQYDSQTTKKWILSALLTTRVFSRLLVY